MPQAPVAHRPYTRNFAHPDETRAFKGHGHLDLVNFEEGITVGRAVFEPGWKWSVDVKPLAGTASCQASHTGQCLSGRMTVRLDNGEEFLIGPGEAYHIPPGHDAWVEGDDECVMIDVTGFKDYAKTRQ